MPKIKIVQNQLSQKVGFTYGVWLEIKSVENILKSVENILESVEYSLKSVNSTDFVRIITELTSVSGTVKCWVG